MSLVCALTGVAPEEPVFSKTGYIFERRAIEKYLRSNGETCPVTEESLTLEDLTPVRVNKSVKPRPITAASIPGLLALMQNEWDSLMAEMFTLRTHLDTVRNQLSHSLYQHDAACRVIARLIKERDSLKKQLGAVQDQLSQSISQSATMRDVGAVVETNGGISQEIGVSEDMIAEMVGLAKTLLAGRKKRKFEGLASVAAVKKFKEKKSFPVHSTTKPGVRCCTLDPKSESPVVVTGGADGVVVMFDINQEKAVGRLQGHLKRINDVIVHPSESIVLSASDDKTVRVWSSPSGDASQYKTSYTFRKHQKAVTSISLHPLGSYFATSSQDCSWAFHDVSSGQTYRHIKDLPCEYSSITFHPDGMLVGAAGKDGKIHIYDMKGDQSLMVSLGPSQSQMAPLTSLEFSENGYYLATSADDGVVRVWDLRKSLNIDTIEPIDKVKGSPSLTNRVKFDNSGNYLAVCGGSSQIFNKNEPNLSIYNFETKSKLGKVVSLEGHEDFVTDACFGTNAEFLISCSLDRMVKYWSLED